jgi:hypothetical protein
MSARSSLLLVVLLGWPFVSGCRAIAVRSAPPKTAQRRASEQAAAAQKAFWSALSNARYEDLPRVIDELTAAYLENPRDPDVALLLAHAHFWRIAEFRRDPDAGPSITDHFLVAEKFFEEAKRLRPSDPRVYGWLGGIKLALSQLHADEREKREGYFMLRDGVELFPEFNHFSLSYAMSVLPRNDRRGAEVVEAMWKNLEACTGSTFDRRDPDYRRFMALEASYDRSGPKRVCWNSELAPHNFEGFFMHMGDVLTKQGSIDAARRAYNNASLSRTYGSWKFKGMLEERLATIEARADAFQRADPKAWPLMMVQTTASCTGCHAR